jgi:hypothetical protein
VHGGLSLATALLAAVPATAAERGLHQPPRATTIAARGDVLAYSRWDAATGAFRLRVAVGDHVPVDVPVAPRSAPFDVHVGRATEPDGTRRTVLVYSRCAKEPPTSTALAPEQLWRGCSLRVAGLAGGELRSAAPARVSSPALSGKKLKFRALHPRKAPAHRRAPFDRAGPPRRNIRPGRGTPVDMDLRGDRLAVIRRYQGTTRSRTALLIWSTFGPGRGGGSTTARAAGKPGTSSSAPAACPTGAWCGGRSAVATPRAASPAPSWCRAGHRAAACTAMSCRGRGIRRDTVRKLGAAGL